MDVSSGFVLTGGRSSRMGRDKALLELEGVSFLERAVKVLAAVASDVRVVSRPDRPYSGFRCIFDRVPGLGPLGGVWTALEEIEEGGCWILGCDLPLMQTRFFDRLRPETDHYDLVYALDSSGAPQLLAGYYSTSCLPAVRKMVAQGERRLRRLTESDEISSKALTPAEHGFSDAIFSNVNTAEDLRKLGRGLRAPSPGDLPPGGGRPRSTED